MTNVTTSHRYAEKALAELKNLRLGASSHNYEIWYTHVEGANPALSSDIQSALDSDDPVTQTYLNELHKKHIQDPELTQGVIDLLSQFHDEVENLGEVLNQSGENTSDNQKLLSSLSSDLVEAADDHAGMGKLLQGLVSVANKMQAENDQLNAKLTESAQEIDTLQHSIKSIRDEAMKDALTGIANRAAFDRVIEAKISAAREAKEPLSLLISDIDHFKAFNDTWGHQTGDKVLQLVAQVMNDNVKGQDLLARYGGEEFVVVLPNTELASAHMLADRIREAVKSKKLKKRSSGEDLGTITMSFGAAQLDSEDNIETLVERADQCLYLAKENGRNCVIDELTLYKYPPADVAAAS